MHVCVVCLRVCVHVYSDYAALYACVCVRVYPFIHMANQVHKNGRPFQTSYFALCTHTSMHLDMGWQYDGILYSLADLHGRFPGLLCTCGLEPTYTDMDCVFLM